MAASFGKKPVDGLTLPTIFMAGLAPMLAVQALSVDSITQAVEQCGAGRNAKTDSCKNLDSMNHLVRCDSTMVEVPGGLEAWDLTAIIRKINQKPQRTLAWGTACGG